MRSNKTRARSRVSALLRDIFRCKSLRCAALLSCALVSTGNGAARAQPPADSPPSTSLMPAVAETNFAPPNQSCLVPGVARCTDYWFDAEYLLWWFKDSPVQVPLITTGPFNGTSTAVLNQPGTQVILGGAPVDTPAHSGMRFTAGWWIDNNAPMGLEASYLRLFTRGQQQSAQTTGLPGAANLAVPYFDNNGAGRASGTPGETIFVLPGPLTFNGQVVPGFQGGFTLAVSNSLQGAEVNGLIRGYRSESFRLDGQIGFRWLEFQEDLSFSGQTQGVPGGLFAGQFYNFTDRFGTLNEFYGGQFGLRAEYVAGIVFVQCGAKIAVGDMQQRAVREGATQTSSGNLFFPTMGTSNITIPGGVFTQPNNIGSSTHGAFSSVGELTVKAGCQLGPFTRLFAGYSLLGISNVLRPGDQIDHVINSTRTGLAAASRDTAGGPAASGPAAPTFLFQEASFWAQGLSCGLELQF